MGAFSSLNFTLETKSDYKELLSTTFSVKARLGEGEKLSLVLKNHEGATIKTVVLQSREEVEKEVSLTVPTAGEYTLVIFKEDGMGNILSSETKAIKVKN